MTVDTLRVSDFSISNIRSNINSIFLYVGLIEKNIVSVANAYLTSLEDFSKDLDFLNSYIPFGIDVVGYHYNSNDITGKKKDLLKEITSRNSVNVVVGITQVVDEKMKVDFLCYDKVIVPNVVEVGSLMGDFKFFHVRIPQEIPSQSNSSLSDIFCCSWNGYLYSRIEPSFIKQPSSLAYPSNPPSPTSPLIFSPSITPISLLNQSITTIFPLTFSSSPDNESENRYLLDLVLNEFVLPPKQNDLNTPAVVKPKKGKKSSSSSSSSSSSPSSSSSIPSISSSSISSSFLSLLTSALFAVPSHIEKDLLKLNDFILKSIQYILERKRIKPSKCPLKVCGCT
jgi:hypothetical protein